MIQRIQTVWLLLAALCNASLFFFDLYQVTPAEGITVQNIRVADHFPSLLTALAITVMPLACIFMYKKRKQQRTFVMLCMVFTLGFIASMLMRVTNFTDKNPTVSGNYWIGAVMPVIALIFLIMAIRGIIKDEKLVRSLDRLR